MVRTKRLRVRKRRSCLTTNASIHKRPERWQLEVPIFFDSLVVRTRALFFMVCSNGLAVKDFLLRRKPWKMRLAVVVIAVAGKAGLPR
ncbi:hypothetical protein D9M70_647240 [compost metagenome]